MRVGHYVEDELFDVHVSNPVNLSAYALWMAADLPPTLSKKEMVKRKKEIMKVRKLTFIRVSNFFHSINMEILLV